MANFVQFFLEHPVHWMSRWVVWQSAIQGSEDRWSVVPTAIASRRLCFVTAKKTADRTSTKSAVYQVSVNVTVAHPNGGRGHATPKPKPS